MGQTERGETPLEREAVTSPPIRISVVTPAVRIRRSGWRPQFGLRSLLVLVLFFGALGGIVSQLVVRTRRQQEAVNHLIGAGCTVHYENYWSRDAATPAALADGPNFWQQVDFWRSVWLLTTDSPIQHSRETLEMIAELPELRTIDIEFAPGSDAIPLPPIASRKQLRNLKLENHILQPGDVDKIVQCQELAMLEINVDDVSCDELAALDVLPKLDFLRISGPLTEEVVASWQHITQLTFLHLDQVDRVSAARLADLIRRNPNLQHVHLKGANCTVEICEALKECQELGQLWLAGSKIDDEGLVKLRLLPKLGDLDIRGSQVRGTAFKGTGSFPALLYATAGGSQIDDEGALHLSKLAMVHTLDLSHTNITDVGCEHLGRREFTDLLLSNNQITDRGASSLNGQSLDRLDLMGTDVSPIPFASSSRWPCLRMLYLGKRADSEAELLQVLGNPALRWLFADGPVGNLFLQRHGGRFHLTPEVKAPASSESPSQP